MGYGMNHLVNKTPELARAKRRVSIMFSYSNEAICDENKSYEFHFLLCTLKQVFQHVLTLKHESLIGYSVAKHFSRMTF